MCVFWLLQVVHTIVTRFDVSSCTDTQAVCILFCVSVLGIHQEHLYFSATCMGYRSLARPELLGGYIYIF